MNEIHHYLDLGVALISIFRFVVPKEKKLWFKFCDFFVNSKSTVGFNPLSGGKENWFTPMFDVPRKDIWQRMFFVFSAGVEQMDLKFYKNYTWLGLVGN